MDMKAIIHIEPNRDLLAILTALGIEWDLALSDNGDGSWALVKLDDATDERLLDLWNRLTLLRCLYIEAMQYNQLPLWEETT